jgi:hypothetical protein
MQKMPLRAAFFMFEKIFAKIYGSGAAVVL